MGMPMHTDESLAFFGVGDTTVLAEGHGAQDYGQLGLTLCHWIDLL